MNDENFIKEFLGTEVNRNYCLPVVRKLLQQRLRKGFYIVKGKIRVPRDDLKENILPIFEALIEKSIDEGYDASLVPTIISKDQAPNFYVSEERPKQDELWHWIKLMITGVYKDNYIFNLDNVSNELIKDFRLDLVNKKLIIFKRERESEGINIGEISRKFGAGFRARYLTEFLFAFLCVSYFVAWIKERQEEESFRELTEGWLPKVIEKFGVTDDATLVVFILHRQKKRVYFIPKLKDFILRWYDDFLQGKEERPSIISFMSSFYIVDKNYRELSLSLLNKFLYYFLNGYINGELLTNMVNLKIKYELKEKRKRPYPIQGVKGFLRKINKFTGSDEEVAC